MSPHKSGALISINTEEATRRQMSPKLSVPAEGFLDLRRPTSGAGILLSISGTGPATRPALHAQGSYRNNSHTGHPSTDRTKPAGLDLEFSKEGARRSPPTTTTTASPTRHIASAKAPFHNNGPKAKRSRCHPKNLALRQAGIRQPPAAYVDYDRDGLLDLLIGNTSLVRDHDSSARPRRKQITNLIASPEWDYSGDTCWAVQQSRCERPLRRPSHPLAGIFDTMFPRVPRPSPCRRRPGSGWWPDLVVATRHPTQQALSQSRNGQIQGCAVEQKMGLAFSNEGKGPEQRHGRRICAIDNSANTGSSSPIRQRKCSVYIRSNGGKSFERPSVACKPA